MQQNQSIPPVPPKPTTQSKEQRAELLRRANILDENGYFVERFFSAETIAKDKARKGQ
jgi:hypothetical protein